MKDKLGPCHIVDLAPARRDTPNLLIERMIWNKEVSYGYIYISIERFSHQE